MCFGTRDDSVGEGEACCSVGLREKGGWGEGEGGEQLKGAGRDV